MTPTEQAARWLADVPRHSGYDIMWQQDGHPGKPTPDGKWIPYADALAAIARHIAPGDDLVGRHADRERNLLLNTALSDLDSIINYHNPEVDTSLNNLVWDRLDKLAVAIEARAAARLSALTADRDQGAQDYCKLMDRHDDLHNENARLRARIAALTATVAEVTQERNGLLTTWAESRERHLAAEAENATLRGILATIVSRCDTAKQQCNDGEPVSAFNLASAILGQIGSFRAAIADGGSNG
ncbi:MAG: bZIP transcription factor [Fuscovulum sp.]|nr:MAG: bZIP transcription factor [Fuscovulum sp.]